MDAAGVRIYDLPITAEKVLAAIKRRRAGEASGFAVKGAT